MSTITYDNQFSFCMFLSEFCYKKPRKSSKHKFVLELRSPTHNHSIESSLKKKNLAELWTNSQKHKNELVILFDYNNYKKNEGNPMENITLHLLQISGKLRNQHRELNTRVNIERKKKSLGMPCTRKILSNLN